MENKNKEDEFIFQNIEGFIIFVLGEKNLSTEVICPVSVSLYDNNGGRSYYQRKMSTWLKTFITSYIEENDVKIMFKTDNSGHGFNLMKELKIKEIRLNSISTNSLMLFPGSSLVPNVAYSSTEPIDRRTNYYGINLMDLRTSWRLTYLENSIVHSPSSSFYGNEVEIKTIISNEFFVLDNLIRKKERLQNEIKEITSKKELLTASVDNIDYVIGFMKENKLTKELKSSIQTKMIMDVIKNGSNEEIQSEVNEILYIANV